MPPSQGLLATATGPRDWLRRLLLCQKASETELANLGVQRLDIHRRLRTLGCGVRDSVSPIQQLPPSVGDQAGLQVVDVREVGNLLVIAQGCYDPPGLGTPMDGSGVVICSSSVVLNKRAPPSPFGENLSIIAGFNTWDHICLPD
jgi:hypothetical protein